MAGQISMKAMKFPRATPGWSGFGRVSRIRNYRLFAQICGLFRLIIVGGLAGLVASTESIAQSKPTVVAARVGDHPDFTRLVLEIDGPFTFSYFTLVEPRRLVVDFPELDFALAADPLGQLPIGAIGAMRYGLFKPGNSRLVLDLAGPSKVVKAFTMEPMDNFGHRFVLDLKRTSDADFIEQARLTRPRQPTPAPVIETPAATVPQRADGKQVVAVDAGHGGVDPGAVGATGIYEKRITLAAALQLAEQLRATGRYHVVLTRETDAFLPLRKRVSIARSAGAELFLSLHADSIGNEKVRGSHVYSLSKTASDAEAAALAAKENKADVIAGLNLAEYSIDVHTILLDLSQRETNNTSVEIADRMVDGFRQNGVQSLNRPHRQAGFAVLKAPDVPSVLIELGFLSNREDEAMLLKAAGRKPIITAIVSAVDKHFATRTVQNQ